MAKVDDILQRGSKQIVLAGGGWPAPRCPPDSESRRRRNHEPPKTGIPKRKKTATHTRLSCKIEYLLRSNHGHSSIASEFFTGDHRRGSSGLAHARLDAPPRGRTPTKRQERRPGGSRRLRS